MLLELESQLSRIYKWFVIRFKNSFYLIIGGLSSALDDKLLHDQGIVAIVTVDIKPLPPNGNLDYLFIQGKYWICLINFFHV